MIKLERNEFVFVQCTEKIKYMEFIHLVSQSFRETSGVALHTKINVRLFLYF